MVPWSALQDQRNIRIVGQETGAVWTMGGGAAVRLRFRDQFHISANQLKHLLRIRLPRILLCTEGVISPPYEY